MEYWTGGATLSRGSPGTSNLRLYMQDAVLPTMQLAANAPTGAPFGHKAHNNALTSTFPQDWRLTYLT